jgi:translation initiation factor IF-3
MERTWKIGKNGDLRGLPEVNVIASSGELLGVMTLADALRLAFKQGLDLVEVKSKASPPVCAIVDPSKQTYAGARGRALKNCQ